MVLSPFGESKILFNEFCIFSVANVKVVGIFLISTSSIDSSIAQTGLKLTQHSLGKVWASVHIKFWYSLSKFNIFPYSIGDGRENYPSLLRW